jgi:hypothetical protein
MSLTSSLPIDGSAYVRSVAAHCAWCFALFHDFSYWAMYCAATSENVFCAKRSASAELLAARRAQMGSTPSLRSFRCCRALSRASARVTVGKLPSPISRCRPPVVSRRTQLLGPDGVTCSASPSMPPTPHRPGRVSRRTSSADSSLALRGMAERSTTPYLPPQDPRIVADFRGPRGTPISSLHL